jgi:hypothetical protein
LYTRIGYCNQQKVLEESVRRVSISLYLIAGILWMVLEAVWFKARALRAVDRGEDGMGVASQAVRNGEWGEVLPDALVREARVDEGAKPHRHFYSWELVENVILATKPSLRLGLCGKTKT